MTKVPFTKEQLAPIFDDFELMEQRIEQLEQLCRDMYEMVDPGLEAANSLFSSFGLTENVSVRQRMTDLGLLDGEQ